MNAKEANLKTKQALEKINAPLIEECLKHIYSKIEKAINIGKFEIRDPCDGYNEEVQSKVYQILKEREYKIEFRNEGYDDYCAILSWKDIKNEP